MIGQPNKSSTIPPKIIWPVLIIVILGLAVGGFFLLNSHIYNEKQGNGGKVDRNMENIIAANSDLLSPQGINTEDWKSYQNTKYGFSFKYPQDWQLNPNLDASTINTASNLVLESTPFSETLVLAVSYPFDCLGIQECVERETNAKRAHDESEANLAEITVAGNDAMWEIVENSNYPDYRRANVYVINGAYIYKLTFRYDTKDELVQLPTFGAVLSSISFDETLKVNQSDIDTSDWLVYQNSEYGYTFKYPDSWTYEVVFYNDDALDRPTPVRVVIFHSPGHQYALAVSIKRTNDVGSGLYWSPAYEPVLGDSITIMGQEITVEESVQDGLVKDFAAPGIAKETEIFGYEFSASFRADKVTDNMRSKYVDISDKVEEDIARAILSTLSL